jgi:selenocysteine lyase/cysteine desulfurase
VNSEFELSPAITYLNHAAVSPWPRRTVEAITRFSHENLHFGAQYYPDWIQTETILRQQFARLINAPDVADIAILKNTSEALSTVAYGLAWQPGDNIVICQQEFSSNRVVWESLLKYGVTITHVDISSGDDTENLIIEHVSKNTRLLSVSAVQYADGLRLDLHRLGEYCQKYQILFCVDAIQALGALQFDVQAVHADFVMADGHKWMLGPEGVALFYSRPEVRELLSLQQYGWHMLERPGDYDATQWEPAKSARRFECGSMNMLGIHAMSASLSLLLEIGMQEIEKRVLEITDALIAYLQDEPCLEILSNTAPARRSGIITFRHKTVAADLLYKYLMKKNVICAARGGGVRFSPHFYTPVEKIQKAIQLCVVTD